MSAIEVANYLNQLEAPSPWWEEEPARWYSSAEQSESVSEHYYDISQTTPHSFDTPDKYMENVFRNNFSKEMNSHSLSTWVWRVNNSAANNYRWKDGTIPKYRRYTVTFRRNGVLDSFADYMVGCSGNVETEWREVVVGNRAQFYVEVKGEWGKFIRPFCIKAIALISREYCDSLSLSLSVFYLNVDEECYKGWFDGVSKTLVMSGIINNAINYLDTNFRCGKHISGNKII